MDDSVFASRRMTEALIKKAELDSIKTEDRTKIREKISHKKQKVALFKKQKHWLWSCYYRSMAHLQRTS